MARVQGESTGPHRHQRTRKPSHPYERPKATSVMGMVKQVAEVIASFFSKQEIEQVEPEVEVSVAPGPVVAVPLMLGELGEIKRPRALPILRPFSHIPRPTEPVIALEKPMIKTMEPVPQAASAPSLPLPEPLVSVPYSWKPAVFSAKFDADEEGEDEATGKHSMEESPRQIKRRNMASSSLLSSPSTGQVEVKPRLKPLVFAPPMTVVEERDRLLKQLEKLQQEKQETKKPAFDFGIKEPGASPLPTQPVLLTGVKEKTAPPLQPPTAPMPSISFGAAPPKFDLPPIAEGELKPPLISFSSPIKVPEKAAEPEKPAAKKPSPLTFNDAPSFSFGEPKAAEPVKSFSFGAASKLDSQEPPKISFGGKTGVLAPIPAITPFSFGGSSAETKEPKPFAFGGSTTETKAPDVKPFSFGAAPAESKPASFAAPETKPFAFGAAPKEESKPIVFGAVKEDAKSFGNPAPAQFTFGGPKEDTKPILFGAPKEDAKPIDAPAAVESKPFAFGSNAPETKPAEVKPFSFGNAAPAFGSAATAFGSSPAFAPGASAAFGSTAATGTSTAFGNASPAIGTAPAFGNSTSAFAPAFGSAASAAFGAPTASPSGSFSFGSALASKPAESEAKPFSFGVQTTAPAPAPSNLSFNFGGGSGGGQGQQTFVFGGGNAQGSPVFPPPSAPPSSSNASAPIPSSPNFSMGTTSERKISQPISKRRFK